MSIGIELGRAAEPAVPGDENVVDPFVGFVAVADAVVPIMGKFSRLYNSAIMPFIANS